MKNLQKRHYLVVLAHQSSNSENKIRKALFIYFLHPKSCRFRNWCKNRVPRLGDKRTNLQMPMLTIFFDIFLSLAIPMQWRKSKSSVLNATLQLENSRLEHWWKSSRQLRAIKSLKIEKNKVFLAFAVLENYEEKKQKSSFESWITFFKMKNISLETSIEKNQPLLWQTCSKTWKNADGNSWVFLPIGIRLDCSKHDIFLLNTLLQVEIFLNRPWMKNQACNFRRKWVGRPRRLNSNEKKKF